MGRNPRAPERMTRDELVAEVQRLRSGSTRSGATYDVAHGLGTYQDELAAQRDELIVAQQHLEHSRDVYADLYDYAPLPYVTLDQWGVVRNINITGSELLGRARRLVEGTPFSRQIQ